MKTKHVLTASAILVVIGALLIASFSVWWRQSYGRIPFDRRLWAEGDAHTRGRMIADLRSVALTGMSESEVLNYLGDPDVISDRPAFGTLDYYYHYQPRLPITPFSESLLVEFDPVTRTVTRTVYGVD